MSENEPFLKFFLEAEKSNSYQLAMLELENAALKPYNIEVKTAGVWEVVDYADSLEDAFLLASSLTQTVREEWIRISTPDNKIL